MESQDWESGYHALAEELVRCEDEIKRLDGENERLWATVSDLRASLAESERRLAVVDETAERRNVEIDRLEAALKEMIIQRDAHCRDADRLALQLDTIQKRNAELGVELAAAREEIDLLENDFVNNYDPSMDSYEGTTYERWSEIHKRKYPENYIAKDGREP